jgi:hypothetical protein
MKLYNYYIGEASTVSFEINQYLKKRGVAELSIPQREEIERYLSTKRILYKVEEKKTHPLWRLTAPIFFLISLLFAISMPFKWIITGSYYYDFDDKPIRFMKKWKMKIMD